MIKRTSSVMVKLLGTARNAGLVLISALALGEEVTLQQAAGYAVCLGFFAAYNYYKMTEPKAAAPKVAPAEDEESLIPDPDRKQ